MLVIKNLTLYLTRDLRTILENFNFSLYAGKKVAVIGEEGNGKSSLLSAIADTDLASGYISIAGDIYKSNEVVGYLLQIIDQQTLSMATIDYLKMKIQGERLDYSLYYKLIKQMDFPKERISDAMMIKNLSGGEKIKFLILCGMMKRPTILLLDEPSNDLDIDSINWLEGFIVNTNLPIMFASHDETLLEHCANTIIHMEQLIRKRKPRFTIAHQGYVDYISSRENGIEKQTQLAHKEKEEYERQMEKYRQINERVQHELRSVSRQSPSVAKNLKDKMHSVKSMGRRFERKKEDMTQRPDYEDSIIVRFGEEVSVPNGRVVLDLKLEKLCAGNLILSKDIRLIVKGPEKTCIVGANGVGKTTLLRVLLNKLRQNNIRFGYMPQDYKEMMVAQENAVNFLSNEKTKAELTKIRTYLGSMNFTPEEMFRSVKSLSGGQRAKLYFSKMILSQAEVLVLDEPTRNLSPISGPEIRKALCAFKGCVIAVSHDRKLVTEVFDKIYRLSESGLMEIDKQGILLQRTFL